MPPRLGYGTGMGNSDMLRGGNGIGVPRPKPAPLPTLCIDFDGHHSGGSSFVYVNDFCYYRNCLYTHRYKLSSEKVKSPSI